MLDRRPACPHQGLKVKPPPFLEVLPNPFLCSLWPCLSPHLSLLPLPHPLSSLSHQFHSFLWPFSSAPGLYLLLPGGLLGLFILQYKIIPAARRTSVPDVKMLMGLTLMVWGLNSSAHVGPSLRQQRVGHVQFIPLLADLCPDLHTSEVPTALDPRGSPLPRYPGPPPTMNHMLWIWQKDGISCIFWNTVLPLRIHQLQVW